MASLTRWAWVWVDSGCWWWTGRPGVLQFMGSQSQTRLSDWTELSPFWIDFLFGVRWVQFHSSAFFFHSVFPIDESWSHNQNTIVDLANSKWHMNPNAQYSTIYSSQASKFSCLVVSNFLWPHGLQHARFLYPSPTPRACSNSCPSNRWCHPTISSSVIPFSSCLQSYPASGSFPISQFFASSGQPIGVSTSASVLPMNIQDWVPLGLTSIDLFL